MKVANHWDSVEEANWLPAPRRGRWMRIQFAPHPREGFRPFEINTHYAEARDEEYKPEVVGSTTIPIPPEAAALKAVRIAGHVAGAPITYFFLLSNRWGAVDFRRQQVPFPSPPQGFERRPFDAIRSFRANLSVDNYLTIGVLAQGDAQIRLVAAEFSSSRLKPDELEPKVTARRIKKALRAFGEPKTQAELLRIGG